MNKAIRTMLYCSLASEDAGDTISITTKKRAFIALNISEVDHNFTTERTDIFNMSETKIFMDFIS